MPIEMECPDCGRGYRLPDSKRGARVRCKECGGKFVVELMVRDRRRGPEATKRSPLLLGLLGAIAILGIVGSATAILSHSRPANLRPVQATPEEKKLATAKKESKTVTVISPVPTEPPREDQPSPPSPPAEGKLAKAEATKEASRKAEAKASTPPSQKAATSGANSDNRDTEIQQLLAKTPSPAPLTEKPSVVEGPWNVRADPPQGPRIDPEKFWAVDLPTIPRGELAASWSPFLGVLEVDYPMMKFGTVNLNTGKAEGRFRWEVRAEARAPSKNRPYTPAPDVALETLRKTAIWLSPNGAWGLLRHVLKGPDVRAEQISLIDFNQGKIVDTLETTDRPILLTNTSILLELPSKRTIDPTTTFTVVPLANRKERKVLTAPIARDAQSSIAVSPGGRYLAMASSDVIHIFELNDCQKIGTINVPGAAYRTASLCFSYTGGELLHAATADGVSTVRLFDLSTGKERWRSRPLHLPRLVKMSDFSARETAPLPAAPTPLFGGRGIVLFNQLLVDWRTGEIVYVNDMMENMTFCVPLGDTICTFDRPWDRSLGRVPEPACQIHRGANRFPWPEIEASVASSQGTLDGSIQRSQPTRLLIKTIGLTPAMEQSLVQRTQARFEDTLLRSGFRVADQAKQTFQVEFSPFSMLAQLPKRNADEIDERNFLRGSPTLLTMHVRWINDSQKTVWSYRLTVSQGNRAGLEPTPLVEGAPWRPRVSLMMGANMGALLWPLEEAIANLQFPWYVPPPPREKDALPILESRKFERTD